MKYELQSVTSEPETRENIVIGGNVVGYVKELFAGRFLANFRPAPGEFLFSEAAPTREEAIERVIARGLAVIEQLAATADEIKAAMNGSATA